MITIFNMHPRLVGFVVATALSLGAGAASASDYRFETAGCLAGNTLAVRLIDQTTGKSVTNARVFAVHRQYLPGKGTPTFIDQKLALTPDGHGRFTYEGRDVQPGANIRLFAQLNGSDIAGSANVC